MLVGVEGRDLGILGIHKGRSPLLIDCRDKTGQIVNLQGTQDEQTIGMKVDIRTTGAAIRFSFRASLSTIFVSARMLSDVASMASILAWSTKGMYFFKNSSMGTTPEKFW
jgi:hypothetical protein